MQAPAEYKGCVEQIENLRWHELSQEMLEQLMLISQAAAVEFAEALRIALQLDPMNPDLQAMAAGELQTDNLKFADYHAQGDHADFLAHFIQANAIEPSEATRVAISAYLTACRGLRDEVRAMSIFSREQELPGIFDRILDNSGLATTPALQAFEYYLREHIALDSTDGGHGDLTRSLPINPEEVLAFWQARLQLYRAIPELFARAEG